MRQDEVRLMGDDRAIEDQIADVIFYHALDREKRDRLAELLKKLTAQHQKKF